MTRNQKIILALWVGGPFVIIAIFFVINPGYASYYFEQTGPVYGMGLILTIQTINALVLVVGFRYLKSRLAIILHRVLTFLLFTLPAYWLAIFWPSALILLSSPVRSGS